MTEMPDPAPQRAGDPDRRRRMLALAGGAVVLAAILVAVLIAVSQSGGDEPTEATSSSGEAVSIDDLPQDGNVIGDPGAPARLVEYADLQCPACAAFARSTIPELIAGPVADGDASLEFSSFLIIGPESLTAAEAAYAAGEQDRLWQFVEAFYAAQEAENSGYVTDAFLLGIAEQAGVPDVERWEEDRRSPQVRDALEADQREAQDLGLSGTPSLSVAAADGGEPEILDNLSTSSIEAAIDEASAGS